MTLMKFFGIIYLETETTAQEREEKDMMVYGDKDSVMVEKDCPFCGERYMGSFPTDGYTKWMGGELIQKAMPTVPATSREWLISGICPECQEKMFGEEE